VPRRQRPAPCQKGHRSPPCWPAQAMDLNHFVSFFPMDLEEIIRFYFFKFCREWIARAGPPSNSLHREQSCLSMRVSAVNI
jgi:hypothetical protein